MATKIVIILKRTQYCLVPLLRTHAFQSNKNILLSDDATMNSKPELEIYADDVKCSHGSTTGELEEEALFYLRSRGISQENATVMLLHGFVGEIIEQIKVEPLKEFLSSKLETRLKVNQISFN